MSATRERHVVAMTADELPDSLRGGFAPGERVRVTVERAPPADWEALIGDLQAFRRINPHPVSSTEAAERVRNLRDEWE